MATSDLLKPPMCIAVVLIALFAAGCSTDGTAVSGEDTSAASAVSVEPNLVLGQPDGAYSVGYGSVRPPTLSLSSLCANTIGNIVWESWGAPTARGTGTACRSASDSRVPTTLVASDVGMCGGVRGYRSLSVTLQGEAPEVRSVC
ncbi:hypothetical protein ABLE92_24130 [Gordonia sp. VNQ95]|uniref:hypothetical protein n=1 Tax=Gordonia sp. VNQ95 TaxID=3156619 RepID=UPI0032B32265